MASKKKMDGQVTEGQAKAQDAYKAKQESKRKLSEDNAKAREDRTPEQQLDLLDKRFGKGQGAKRERARLLKQIEEKKNKKGKAKNTTKETSEDTKDTKGA